METVSRVDSSGAHCDTRHAYDTTYVDLTNIMNFELVMLVVTLKVIYSR
jgi:hypothetical protein